MSTKTTSLAAAMDMPWAGEDDDDLSQTSLLDLVDHVLDKGIVLRGDLVLGVAGVDLVYIELRALLCAADRILPPKDGQRR